jgi:hypothetical protein
VETLQGVELTSTNWPCGLTLSSKANIEANVRSPRSHSGAIEARERAGCSFAALDDAKPVSGGYIGEAIPDPISNSEVKLSGADGTARTPCGRVGRCRANDGASSDELGAPFPFCPGGGPPRALAPGPTVAPEGRSGGG